MAPVGETAGSLEGDRAALRERWYAEGYYGPESMFDHLRLGAERHPDVVMHFVGGPRPGRTDSTRCMGAAGDSPLASLSWASGPATSSRSGCRTGWREQSPTRQRGCSGAVVVPIIPIYGPREVGFILRQSGARVLVMPDSWRDIDYSSRLETAGDVHTLEQVVMIGEPRFNGAIAWDRLAARRPIGG